MMRIRRATLIDIYLLIIVVIQLLVILCNLINTTDYFNIIIYYLNYIIIGLIIISLIKKDGMKNFLIILFYICFFIFLMAQKIFKEEKNVFLTFSRTVLDTSEYFLFLSIITSALCITYYSYLFFINKNIKNAYYRNKITILFHKNNVLFIVRIIYFLTLICTMYMQIKIVSSRSMLSYTAGYLENVNIPNIIKIGNYINTAFSLIYLALKPSKKEIFFILTLFLLFGGGIQLIQGRRALFATTLFFVIWYLLKYYEIKHINYKYILFFIIGGVTLIILFFFVEMSRSNLSITNMNIGAIIEKFMISTGGSDSVLANTIINRANFPEKGIYYLLDPIINNPISIILNGKSGIVQGPLFLENFNSFSHWISFLTQADLYYSGHGMGSCYLAEIYIAFGYFGIVLLSIGLGGVLSFMSKVNLNGSFFKTSIIFIFVQNIFTLPRDGLFSFFNDLTYLFIGFCIIFPFCKVKSVRLFQKGECSGKKI